MRDTSSILAMRKLVETGEGSCQTTFTRQINTTTTAHRVANYAAHVAVAMGLKATLTSDGGWLTRSHRLTVKGEVTDVLRWWDSIKGLLSK